MFHVPRDWSSLIVSHYVFVNNLDDVIGDVILVITNYEKRTFNTKNEKTKQEPTGKW